MAQWRANSNGGGTTGTGNRTSTIAALSGDLLLVYVQWSANSNTSPTCTDNGTGTNTYTLVLTALCHASADICAVFVRNALVAANATLTIAPVVGGGTNTAGEIVTIAVTGMTKVGAAAIRQSAKQENQTTGVPNPILPQNVNTNNMTLTSSGMSLVTGCVPNAGWTEREDASQASPVTGMEVATDDSGFGGTGGAYVSTTSALWNATIVELDAAVLPIFVDQQYDVGADE